MTDFSFRIWRVFVLAVFLLWDASPAFAASPAAAYKAYDTKAFYFFGEEAFERFTCGMRLDVAEGLVSGLRSQVASGVVPLQITDTLNAFSLTYTRAGDTVSFVRPTFTAVLAKNAKVQDEKALQEGLKKIRAGFEKQVVGAIGVLQGILDEYQLSRFDGIEKVTFAAEGKGYRLAYSKAGSNVKVHFDGEKKRSEIRVGAQAIEMVGTYKPFPGKGLALGHVTMKPAPNHEIAVTIDYETVDKILIPSKLAVMSKQKIGTGSMEAAFTIMLGSCVVSR